MWFRASGEADECVGWASWRGSFAAGCLQLSSSNSWPLWSWLLSIAAMMATSYVNRYPPLLVIGLAATMALGSLPFTCGADEHQFFESRIRPILVTHCYECHSGAAPTAEGSLLLDSREAVRRGGDSGPALVPGMPGESLLLDALRYQSLEMPPAGKLPDQVIADFEEWIRRGAPDPRDHPPTAAEAAEAAWKARLIERSEWWSLQDPIPAVPPDTTDVSWSSEPVDRFIHHRLSMAGLTPAASADADVLLRRLSFVLTGLPPLPQQLLVFRNAFTNDPDMALQQEVDRILASDACAERFARHWMDVVRYTDTYGYEWDNPARGSWEYRDYLIRAFQSDVGFDQLILEQIAGDLLPEPRIDRVDGINESLIGPMFYHMGEHRHGTSLDFNGIHQEMIDNKIDAFSRAFLGMTVACARCHDHKLDAVSQADYYALAGVFMTPRWTPRDLASPNHQSELISELKQLREDIRMAAAKAWTADSGSIQLQPDMLRKWAMQHQTELKTAPLDDIGWPLGQMLNTSIVRLPSSSIEATSQITGDLKVEADGSILATSRPIPKTATYTVQFTTGPGTGSLLQLEALTHDSLGSGGPGRTAHGNFVLTHLQLAVRPFLFANAANGTDTEAEGEAGGDGERGGGSQASSAISQPVSFSAATADFSQTGYPVSAALDPSPQTGWGIGGVTPLNVDRTAQFLFAEPVELPYGGEWTLTLTQAYGDEHVLGRFRVAVGNETAPDPASDREVSDRWQRLMTEWSDQQTSRQQVNERQFSVITDFRDPGVPQGWAIDGLGMQEGYAADGTPLISLQGDSLLNSFLHRGYHTHALSSKLAGAVRLPRPETFPQSFVSLRMAGAEWAGRIDVPQNAFQAEGVSFFDPNAAPTWHSVTTQSLNNGVTRVLTEFCTSSLNPNFPPRTGLARAGSLRLPDNDDGFHKRSWFSLTGIVAHSAAGRPTETLEAFAPLFQSSVPDTVDEAWVHIAAWLKAAVDRWADQQSIDGDVQILNWLLTHGLLPNTADSMPEAARLVERYRHVEQKIKFARSTISMDERGVQPVDYRLNIRGNVDDEGLAVPRNFLEVFANRHQVGQSAGSGRLELARHLASSENPQTARVYVNRVWQWMFGTGIVATSSDFGRLGDSPSHPELLDWMTIRFMQDGWSTKQLIRRLALSQTFRQSGQPVPAAVDRDPENRLLHHYPTRRMEAEVIRDSLLAVSGRLNPQRFGPPINPPRVAEDAAKRLYSGPWDTHGRRSIYITMSIMAPPKFLVGFNLPDLKLPTGRRDQTNVPAQALMMLNDPLVTELAEFWAEQLISDGCTHPDQRLTSMFLQAVGREPTARELQWWHQAVSDFASSPSDLMQDQPAWAQIAHAIFNTREFIYYR